MLAAEQGVDGIGADGDGVGAAGAVEEAGFAGDFVGSDGVGHDEFDGAVGVHGGGDGDGHEAEHDGLVTEAVLRGDGVLYDAELFAAADDLHDVRGDGTGGERGGGATGEQEAGGGGEGGDGD